MERVSPPRAPPTALTRHAAGRYATPFAHAPFPPHAENILEPVPAPRHRHDHHPRNRRRVDRVAHRSSLDPGAAPVRGGGRPVHRTAGSRRRVRRLAVPGGLRVRGHHPVRGRHQPPLAGAATGGESGDQPRDAGSDRHLGAGHRRGPLRSRNGIPAGPAARGHPGRDRTHRDRASSPADAAECSDRQRAQVGRNPHRPHRRGPGRAGTRGVAGGRIRARVDRRRPGTAEDRRRRHRAGGRRGRADDLAARAPPRARVPAEPSFPGARRGGLRRLEHAAARVRPSHGHPDGRRDGQSAIGERPAHHRVQGEPPGPSHLFPVHHPGGAPGYCRAAGGGLAADRVRRSVDPGGPSRLRRPGDAGLGLQLAGAPGPLLGGPAWDRGGGRVIAVRARTDPARIRGGGPDRVDHLSRDHRDGAGIRIHRRPAGATSRRRPARSARNSCSSEHTPGPVALPASCRTWDSRSCLPTRTVTTSGRPVSRACPATTGVR